MDTPEPQTHVIPEGKQQGKVTLEGGKRHTQVWYHVQSKSYDNIQKYTSNFQKGYYKHINNTYKLRLHCSHIPQKYTITVETVAHHITCETTGKVLGYRD